MTLARGLAAASLSLALMGALNLANHTTSVHAEDRHSIQATLVVNGKSRMVTSEASRLSDLLAQAGVTLGPNDEIHPDPSCRTFDGMTVAVNTPQKRMDVVRLPTSFPTIYRRTIRLLPGRRSVARPGLAGLKEEHFEVVAVGSRQLSRTLTKTGWYRKPSPRVILVGTDPFTTSRGVEGIRRSLNMVASEYDVYLGGAGTGHTCTGIKARRGIVAVDPRVIPLGTRLYVEGYGYCVAADTGGAIKGHRIDLCVNTPAEADRYGMHRVRVIVLE